MSSNIITRIVKKGRHFSRPFQIRKIHGGATWYLFFDETWRYKAKHPSNQKDRVKLVGIKQHYFSPMKSSVMAGGYYDEEQDAIMIQPYIHLKGVRGAFYNEFPMVKHPLGKGGFVVVSIHENKGISIKSTISGEKVSVDDAPFFPLDWKRGWEILHYFGGTEKAPHDINLTVNKL